MHLSEIGISGLVHNLYHFPKSDTDTVEKLKKHLMAYRKIEERKIK